MSRDIKNREQLRGVLDSGELVCALFYASWCPYSRQFLPEFEAQVRRNERKFSSIRIDDIRDLCEEYEVEVYPTVIFFKNGNIFERLDGVPGAGIAHRQFAGLLEKCLAGETEK
jgi:thiol-disulfide isomerase/thioredoxin